MSRFAVTAVRWNSELTEISECLVHLIETLPDGRMELTSGTGSSAKDLASIIARGDEAWVVTSNDAGAMELRAPLQVGGQDEQLYTSPQCTLFDLPTF
jgi:hypothetical protein